AYLKERNYSFTGNQYLDIKLQKTADFAKIMAYVQEQGSLLIKQTQTWDNKSLRFSFSSQKSVKGLKKSQIFFTPSRDLSKADLQKFKDNIWSHKPVAKDLPAFYLEVIKYGDLSIYPGAAGEEMQRKISQAAIRAIEEKMVENTTKIPP